MPLKKKEEVCGKPNQYNLQTLEYDWKELPDTHFQLPPRQPRVRSYSPAQPSNFNTNTNGVGAPPPPPKLNPITHQPLPSAVVGPSYTPLPSPSKPAQEDVKRAYNNNNVYTPQSRYANNNQKDHVADLFGEATPSPGYNTPLRFSPASPDAQQRMQQQQQQQLLHPTASPGYTYDVAQRAMNQSPSRSPPPNSGGVAAYSSERVGLPAHRSDGYTVLPWSHEDIRRVVTSNALEAQRSYLR